MSSIQPSTLPNIAPIGSSSTSHNVQALAAPSLPFTDAQVDAYREQDRWLPIANVGRIMKASLPSSAKVSKEAKESIQECVSEFISFISSEGADKCLNDKRKTITGEDILTSMRTLGFDNYEEVMKVYLAKYREHQILQTKQRQHISGDETTEQSDEVDGIAAKRKRKRNGEGVAGTGGQQTTSSFTAEELHSEA